MSQPPNAPMVAPRARCRASSGESLSGPGISAPSSALSRVAMAPTVACAAPHPHLVRTVLRSPGIRSTALLSPRPSQFRPIRRGVPTR